MDNPKITLHRAVAWNDFNTLPPVLRFRRDYIVGAKGSIMSFGRIF